MLNNTTETVALLPRWAFTSFGVYLTTAGVVGALANGTSLYVFLTNKHLRSPTNVFIIGLLSCDFLMCTVGIPLPASSNFAGKWLFGWSGCVFHGFTVYVLGLSNLYILCAIAVDRYIIIAKPLQAAKINYRIVNVSIFLCYLFGFLWSSFPFLGWSSYVFEGAGTACAISYDYNDPLAFSYNIAICINCFLIPIVVILYCYYYVYMTVCSSNMTPTVISAQEFTTNETILISKLKFFISYAAILQLLLHTIRTMARNTVFDKKSRVAKRNLRIERKMAKTVAMIIGVYFFAWTPYAIVAFWTAFGFGIPPIIVFCIPSFFAKSASVWNPIIYVFTNKQFRRAFYELIPCSGLKAKLIQKEEKEAESEQSDIEDDKSKSSVVRNNVRKVQQSKRPGIQPIDETDDAGEVTIVEHITSFDDSVKMDETELKDMGKSKQGASKF